MGDALLPLPEGGPAKATRKPAASIARCATRGYAVVPCSKRHAWRATYAFGVTAKGGEKKVAATIERAAARTCPRKVTSKRWLRSSRGIAENRYAVACFSQTKR